MLGDMIGVVTGLIRRGDILQARVILLRQRRVGAVDVIEDGEFHGPVPA